MGSPGWPNDRRVGVITAHRPADLGGYGFRHAWSGARADRVDLCAATKLSELAGRALTPAPNQPSGSPGRSVHQRRKPTRLVLHGFLRGASGQVCKPDPGAQSSRWLGRVRVRLGSGAGLRLGSLRASSAARPLPCGSTACTIAVAARDSPMAPAPRAAPQSLQRWLAWSWRSRSRQLSGRGGGHRRTRGEVTGPPGTLFTSTW